MTGLPTLTLQLARIALRLPLPGRTAQQTMAVRPRPGDLPDLPRPCPHEGSVLLLLYLREGRLALPLTRRTQTVEMHRGQISLPGGAREPQDHGYVDTALRETREELGVAEESIEIVGQLTPLYIPPSRFCVYPYVGHIDRPPYLRPDPREVAEVIEMSVESLLDPATEQLEVRIVDQQRFEVPYYSLAGHKVWGATAMILAEFAALLRSASALRSMTAPPYDVRSHNAE